MNKLSDMKILFVVLILFFSAHQIKAQDNIVLDLDSIKNIKATRYSSINEVGVGISLGGKMKQKLPFQTTTIKLENEKPGVMFRTVHGALINPTFFIGAGTGIDFSPNQSNGIRAYSLTFPFFAEFREYILDGNFKMFFSQRLGAAIFIDSYRNQQLNSGKYSGAFGEFMIGGRYVTPEKKIAIHFGVGYRLQHLQRKVDVQSLDNGNIKIYSNTREITVKHYIPITIGITY